MSYEEYENIIKEIITLEGIGNIRKKFSEASFSLLNETYNAWGIADKKALVERLSEIIVWVHAIISYYKIGNDFNDKEVGDMAVKMLEKMKRQENMEEYLNTQKKLEKQI